MGLLVRAITVPAPLAKLLIPFTCMVLEGGPYSTVDVGGGCRRRGEDAGTGAEGGIRGGKTGTQAGGGTGGEDGEGIQGEGGGGGREGALQELYFWLRGAAAVAEQGKGAGTFVSSLRKLAGPAADVQVCWTVRLPLTVAANASSNRAADASTELQGGAHIRLLRWAHVPLETPEDIRRALKVTSQGGTTATTGSLSRSLSEASGRLFRRMVYSATWGPPKVPQQACLVLGDGNGGRLHLQLKVLQTRLAQRWLAELRRVEAAGLGIKHPDRTYHFPGSCGRSAGLAVWQDLADLARTIEVWRPGSVPELWMLQEPGFDIAAEERLALQEKLNILHKRFEIMRGSIDNPGQLFREAPLHVKEAIQDYNLAIHRLEGLLAHWVPWRPPPSPSVVVAFDHSRRRVPLEEWELAQFEPCLRFGEVYLNYCEVGKHLLEAFVDGDEVVGDSNLRPQSHLSADVKLHLGPTWPATRSRMLQRDAAAWFQERGMAASLGAPWGSPSLTFGYAPVAELDRSCMALAGLEEQAVVARIGAFPTILGLRPLQ